MEASMNEVTTMAAPSTPPATTLGGPATRESALEGLRRSVLEALRGPGFRSVHEIPRRWPVLRAHVSGVVDMLLKEGLVERTANPGKVATGPAYRATAAGQQELARSFGGASMAGNERG
jgi:DNA-binding MarR family transcriptional regulator